MTMKRMPKGRRRLEHVVWEDPTSKSTWMDSDEITTFMGDKTFIVHTVGWVIREDKHAIGIAATINDTDEYVGQIFRIPKATIRKRTRLKQP